MSLPPFAQGVDVEKYEELPHRKFLKEHTVEDVLGDKNVMCEVPETATVGETLDTLAERNILSVPVSVPVGSWIGAGGVEAPVSGNRQYIGVVSVLDIALFLSEAVDEHRPKMLTQKITSLIGKTNEGKSLWLAEPTQTLDFAIEPFGKGVHRMLAPKKIDNTTHYRFLAQSDFVAFILNNTSTFAHLLDLPLTSCLPMPGHSAHGVATLHHCSPVVDGLRQLRFLEVGAVAVINDTGMLVGTLSASDLRGITPKTLSLLLSPVYQFLSRNSEANTPPPPLCVTPQATLGMVLKATQEHRVHRVWVVNEAGQPVGVVTLTDALSVFGPLCH